MSPPLTVAWKDQAFHVCGGEEMSCRRGEGGRDGGGGLWSGSLSFFLTFAQRKKQKRGGWLVWRFSCIFLYAQKIVVEKSVWWWCVL